MSFFFIISFVLLKPGSRETRRRRRRVFCCDVVESDFDASAEKTDGGERCVGFDCEVRRYLFQTHSSEIEFDGFEILVRSEYGDEKVDQEIISQGGVEREV